MTFAHFGSHSVYESANPDLVIEILRGLKKPKSQAELLKTLKVWTKQKIVGELGRLERVNYIVKLKSVSRKQTQRVNPILSKIVPNRDLLLSASERISTCAIGVIDLAGIPNESKKNFKRAGFDDLQVSRPRGGHVAASFIKERDFFIVVATANQKVLVSKLNQQFVNSGKKWLYVDIDMFGGTIGPTFGLAGGPCYECLLLNDQRVYHHGYKESDHINLIGNQGHFQAREDEFLAACLFPHVVVEAAKIVSGIVYPQTFDGYYSMDTFNLRMEYTSISPSPVCPVCAGEKISY